MVRTAKAPSRSAAAAARRRHVQEVHEGDTPPMDEVNEVKESDGDSDLDQVSEVKDKSEARKLNKS